MNVYFQDQGNALWRFVVIGVLLLVGCAPAGATPVCPPIRVGVIMDARDSSAAKQQIIGFDAAIKDINQAGIGENCPLEWVAAKDLSSGAASDPQQVMKELVGEGVVAVIAPTSAAGAKRTAAMARYFSVPVIIPGDSDDEILEGDQASWSFQINPSAKAYATAAFEMVRLSQTSFIANAAIFFEATEYGESAAVVAGQAALRNNISIATYQRFSPYLEDFKEIQDSILVKHPNTIYLISSQTKQAESIVRAIRAIRDAAGKAPLIQFFFVNGSAFTDPQFLYDSQGVYQPVVDNLIFMLPWAGNVSHQDAPICQMNGAPKIQLGDAPAASLTSVQAYISLSLVADAIRRTTENQTWTVNEKKIHNWAEMFSNQDNFVIFKRALADTLQATSMCQFGSYLWPIQFNSGGQNDLPPVLVKINNGTMLQVLSR